MKPAPVGSTKKYEPVPAGNHVARLIEIINIGTLNDTYQGEPRQVHKVRMSFELCNETKVFKEGEPPKPYTVSRKFTYSMAPKSHLRPFVEGMIGAPLTDEEAGAFMITSLLGKECLLNVVHRAKDGNTYADIKGASPLPKGMIAPPVVNTPHLIDVDTITEEELAKVPKFIQDEMRSSVEWTSKNAPHDPKNGYDDINPKDIPF